MSKRQKKGSKVKMIAMPGTYRLRGLAVKQLQKIIKPEGFEFQDDDLVVVSFGVKVPVVLQVVRGGDIIWPVVEQVAIQEG